MEYYFTKIISASFDEAVTRATEALKTEGFGIVSEIDLNEKFREKLNVDFRKYKILGACNPGFAYKAVQAEEKIGVMLPCNVLIIDKENGTTEITIVDPVASMMAVKNEALAPLAGEVREKLRKVIDTIQ